KERLYVGELKRAEVIDDDMAARALRAMRKSGHLATMAREIVHVGGAKRILNADRPTYLLNVRFRPNWLLMHRNPVPATPHDRIQRYSRYTAILADGRLVKQWEQRTKRAPLQ